ncbi:tetratricopeptide repeat protein [Mucilaginibacter sp.]
MRYKYILVLTIAFVSCAFTASANYAFDARCMQAYRAIFDLRLNEARSLIQQEKQLSPQNGIPVLLDNYVDYITLLTSDNKADYKRLLGQRSNRLDALEANEEESPYYLYSQAEVYMQWGLLKGKFGDYMSSASDLKKARNLLEDNAKKYPDFLPDQKCLALINVVFGALPSNLKSVARFLGMAGNIEGGVSQLEKLRTQVVGTKYAFYKEEIVFFLCYMNIDVLHKKDSYGKLTAYLNDMDSKSLLRMYLQGYVAAKTGHNDDAIANLQALPKANQYIQLPVADYLLACAKLCRMDTDSYLYFLRYINEYKGENYIKDSYLKIAYYYLLNNDEDKYNSYLKLVRSKGYIADEKDQQALKEANDARPDNDLLKARFYFDGGYYAKALAQLQGKKEADLKLQRDKIELNYRLGRVYQLLNKYNEAITCYNRAIAIGKTSNYYFAANAALCIGNIYESIKDYNLAANYYNQALCMHHHEYQNSIDTQAKEGLERINH